MRIHIEKDGAVFEYETQPTPKDHFRAVCALAAAGLYVGMVAIVAALCGTY